MVMQPVWAGHGPLGCKHIYGHFQSANLERVRIAGHKFVGHGLVYAFLLANPARTRGMLADLTGVLDRIKARGGVVVDLDSRLDSETNPAFLTRSRVAG